MILTCPECNTKYTVPDAAFKDDGRTFRCANCKHTWFEKSPNAPEKPAIAEKSEPVFPEAIERPIPPIDEETKAKSLLQIKASGKAISAFLMIFIIVLYPVAYRKDIIRDSGALARVLEVFGIYNTDGLAISDAKMVKTQIDDKTMRVRLDCSVINEAKDKRDVPGLIATLLNTDGKEILRSQSLIEPGKKIHSGEVVPCKQFVFDMKENEVDRIKLDLADSIDLSLRKK